MNRLKVLLIAIMALCCCNAVMAHDFEVDGIYYNITSSSDLTVEVTYGMAEAPDGGSYKVYSQGDIVIPSKVEYNGNMYNVTGIGEYAFNTTYFSGITSISIPNSVTSIGAAAFADCEGLTSITIPGSVKSIGIHAFVRCLNLTQVTIQEGVTTIGGGAFSGCVGLTSVTIPSSVKEIGTQAFADCTGLESVTISNGVTSIGEEAFQACSSLNSIVIPPSITNIGEYAFYDCTSLSAVHISNIAAWCNIDFGSIMDSNPLYYAHNLYLNGDVVEHLNIPYGVTEIKEYAFLGCSSLKNVEISQSVTSIGEDAFNGCSGISSVVVPKSVTNLGVGAFAGCTGELIVNCNIPDKAFYASDFTKVVINEGVTSIGVQAFNNCNNLTSLTIPSSVTSFGRNAFSGCTGELFVNCNIPYLERAWGVFSGSKFTKVVIGDGVTSIGSCAFYYCPDLETVVIPDGVISIEDYAFGMCEKLKSISIPKGVKCIEENTFFSCGDISDVYISDVATWCNIDFKGHPMDNSYSGVGNLYLNGELVTELTIPNTVSKINPDAFWGFDCITSVTIPESVTSIGQDAFSDCEGLSGVYISSIAAWCNIDFDGRTANPLLYAKNLYLNGELVDELDIPYGVEEIKDYAFYECSSLTNLNLSFGVTAIGADAFYGCRNLESVDIPDYSMLTTIDGFGYCSNLKNITIPQSVTSIAPFAFSGCENITNVYIGSIEKWCEIFFEGNLGQPLQYAKNLYVDGELVTDLVIPDIVTSIGLYAFYGCTALSSITIPESVESIDDSAFAGCTGEVRVNCFIEEGVFVQSKFSKLTIGENMTDIGECAFRGCRSFTSVSIPASLNVIGEGTFSECSGLTSVLIPEGVTEIRGYAFDGCSSLESVTIPESVTSIGFAAFSQCNNLEEVHISDLEAWCNIDFNSTNPFSCARSLYLNGELVTDITIPESITEIKAHTFNGCNSLTSVAIPDNVTSINSNAFAGCTSLTTVSLSSPVPPTLNGTEIFPSNTATLTIPMGSYSAYEATGWTSYFSSIEEKEYDNMIYIDDVTVYRNSTVSVPLQLKNSADITAVQFDLYLPLGVTLEENSRGTAYKITFNEERADATTHTLSSALQEDGSIRVLCYSTSSELFWGNEGSILYFPMIIPEMESGSYEVAIKNIILTDTQGAKYEIPSIASLLNVLSVAPGDCNGDNVVDVADIVVLANHILGNTIEGFMEVAADYNNDDAVDVADIVNIANHILGGNKARSLVREVLAARVANVDYSFDILPFVLGIEGSKTITLDLADPTESFTAFQCDFYLPEGLSIDTNNRGKYKFSFNEERTDASYHTLSGSLRADGAVRMLCYSTDSEVFLGTEGALINIPLTADASLASGVYEFTIANTVLTYVSGEKVEPETYKGSIVVGDGGEVKEVKLHGKYTADVLEEFSIVLAANSGITSVDLTEAVSVDSESTLTTGNPNTLVYLAEGVSLANTCNVVSGDECSSLVLTDDYAFDAPVAFTAAQASYTRELASGKYGTIVLPFTPNVEEYAFYALTSADDNSLTFDEVAQPEANTPYLYTLRDGESGTAITALNVQIEAADAVLEADEWSMVGSYNDETIDCASATDTYYYAYSSANHELNRVTKTLTVKPYRAYLTSSSAMSKVKVRTRGGETVIDAAEIDNDAPVYYDLSGRRVPQPTKGVYIVNGKKIVL